MTFDAGVNETPATAEVFVCTDEICVLAVTGPSAEYCMSGVLGPLEEYELLAAVATVLMF